jgi:cysteine desulfurase
VAALLGCASDEIVFTSGGTEANNLAILGSAFATRGKNKLLTSTVEHPAVHRPCDFLTERGWVINRIPVDQLGTVDLATPEAVVDERYALVTVMHANNETGSIQPIREIAEAAHRHGVLVHSDAAQSAGKIPTRVSELGVDLLSLAGHKLYAPKGVGALYVRRGTPIQPYLLGAGQERGLRPGTENVAGIVGLGAACELAKETMGSQSERLRSLRDDLWRRLSTEIPEIRLNGHPEERLPNTLNVSFPGVRGSAVLARATEIAASTGAACHEGGAETPSRILTAMGLAPDVALGAVRLSLGHSTTGDQVARSARILVDAFKAVPASSD